MVEAPSQEIPFKIKYIDSFGNICTRNVDWPQVVSNFFASFNVINMHNQLHQDSLKLEKKWLTQNLWFRLAAMYVGICGTDAFLLLNYHQLINVSKGGLENQEKKVSVVWFAGISANQLIQFLNKVGSSKESRSLITYQYCYYMHYFLVLLLYHASILMSSGMRGEWSLPPLFVLGCISY
jgi:hypothetical protein